MKLKLIVFAVALLLGVFGLAAKFFYFDRSTLITTNGVGKAQATPQVVKFTVSFTNIGGKASDVVATNSAATRNVVNILKSFGITDQDIQVGYTSVLYPGSSLGQAQYSATNSIDVTFRNLSRFDSLFTTLYQSGVQSISNIVFTVDNARDLEKQAVALAITDAQSRVEEIAKSMGKRVERIVSIATGEVGDAGAVSGQVSSGLVGQNSSSPSRIEISRQASIMFELR